LTMDYKVLCTMEEILGTEIILNINIELGTEIILNKNNIRP